MYSYLPVRGAQVAPLFFAAALSLAAQPALSEDDFLASLDLDGDGVVTVEEAVAARNARFEDVDRNADGFIDASEFDALLQATRTRYASLGQNYHAQNASPGRIDAFTFADSDADGLVSPEEYDRSSARFARSLDRNGDGVITPFELAR